MLRRPYLCLTAAELESGFSVAHASDAPAWSFFRELLQDESAFPPPRRMQLLEWCTSHTALPCGGLKRLVSLKLYEGASDADLPETHTCSQQVHLPPYTTRACLQAASWSASHLVTSL